jgi:regulator of replication initiation timing
MCFFAVQYAAVLCSLWHLHFLQFNSLRTTNNQIKVQVLTLQLSKTDLLSRLTDLTGKWRSTVADNIQLQQDNAVLRDRIAKAKQQLAETPSPQQQQQHERSPKPKHHRLPWLPHCAELSSERVPRAQSV